MILILKKKLNIDKKNMKIKSNNPFNTEKKKKLFIKEEDSGKKN